MTPTETQIRLAILAGCVVAFVGFGSSASFGVFVAPISAEFGWGREVMSLSVAVQMLVWGIAQPVAGAIADRYGTARVLAAGAVIAAAGYGLRAVVTDPTAFVLTGIPVGLGIGAASFPIVVGALGKIVGPERRSLVMGLGTSAASMGMFVAAPAASAGIATLGWQSTLLLVAASFAVVLAVLGLIARVSRATAPGAPGAFGIALRTAFTDRSYLCLFAGFFVCGFHVAFMQTHLPAYITDLGFAAALGATALALIGLFNIAGSFLAGWSGQVLPKVRVLAGLYLARAAVITAFLLIPASEASVVVFAAAMGLLWLSTVPLTMGLVAQTQGLRYLATLSGLVFLSHQVGSFIGAWLGGRLYDLTGSYDAMWWAAVVLGLLAALIHLPIREEPGPLARAEA